MSSKATLYGTIESLCSLYTKPRTAENDRNIDVALQVINTINLPVDDDYYYERIQDLRDRFLRRSNEYTDCKKALVATLTHTRSPREVFIKKSQNFFASYFSEKLPKDQRAEFRELILSVTNYIGIDAQNVFTWHELDRAITKIPHEQRREIITHILSLAMLKGIVFTYDDILYLISLILQLPSGLRGATMSYVLPLAKLADNLTVGYIYVLFPEVSTRLQEVPNIPSEEQRAQIISQVSSLTLKGRNSLSDVVRLFNVLLEALPEQRKDVVSRVLSLAKLATNNLDVSDICYLVIEVLKSPPDQRKVACDYTSALIKLIDGSIIATDIAVIFSRTSALLQEAPKLPPDRVADIITKITNLAKLLKEVDAVDILLLFSTTVNTPSDLWADYFAWISLLATH